MISNKGNNMKNKLRLVNPLIAPLLSLGFIVCSSSPFTTFISLKLQAENITETIIGFVHAAFYLGFLVGSIRAEKVIKRIGYIRAFSTFSALFGFTILILSLKVNPILWMFMRFLAGLSIAEIYVIIESWLLAGSTSKTRGRILSIYMVILYASQSFSQLFLNITPLTTTLPFIMFAILCFASIIPVTLNYSKAPETSHEGEKITFKETYNSAPFSFFGCLISGLLLSSIYSFLPLYAKLSNISAPYIMTITLAGGFLLQWPLGLLSDMFNRRKVLLLISIFVFVPSFIIIFLNHTITLIFSLCFMIGGFTFAIYPISITQVCDRFDSKHIPYVIGIMSLAYSIGAIFGPILTSLFMELTSEGIFIYIAILSAILSFIGLYYIIKNPLITPKAEKTEFLSTSGTMQLKSDLDPRTFLQENKKD